MEDQMRKLSDGQFILLSSAASHDDGAATAPDAMTKQAAARLGASLVARGLMREGRSKPGIPVWRTGRDGRSLSLIITDAGRDAIGVIDKARDAKPDVQVRAAGDNGSATDRPRTKVAKDAAGRGSRRSAHTKSAVDSAVAAKVDEAVISNRTPIASPRSGSKQALVLAMLIKPDGATLDALVAATGWLPHTTRAALTGLRKRGYAIEPERDGSGGPSVYRASRRVEKAA
jgi:hypothetical protein